MRKNSMLTNNSQLINQLPGVIGFKDVNSTYIAGNNKLARLMGYASAEDILGCCDADAKSEIAALAGEFVAQDKKVMLQGEQQHVDIGHHADGDLRIHLSTKKPLYNDDQTLLGTVYNCISLRLSILKAFQPILAKPNAPVFYSLGKFDQHLELSTRESECLFYLLRGYTAKEIAEELSLSAKTVEYYTEQLKNKLVCSKKSELVERAIELGFMFNIPMSIFKKITSA